MDRAVEEEHVLLDDPDQASVLLERELAKIDAIEQYGATGWIEETGDEVREGGLACARGRR